VCERGVERACLTNCAMLRGPLIGMTGQCSERMAVARGDAILVAVSSMRH